MNNIRESIQNYINILSDEELNQLYLLILQNAPVSKPLSDEILIANEINPNDEYVNIDEINWE